MRIKWSLVLVLAVALLGLPSAPEPLGWQGSDPNSESNKERRLRRKRFVAISLLAIPILCLCSFLYLFYPYWLSFDPAPNLELIPTAQYFLDHPERQPDFLPYLDPPPGCTIGASENICFTIYTAGLSPVSNPDAGLVANHTVLMINNQAVPIDYVQFTAVLRFLHGRSTDHFDACTSTELESGLHLFELRTSSRDLPWGRFGIGLDASYTWAYRVE